MKYKYSAFTELTDEAIEWVEDTLGCGMIIAFINQRENLWMLFDNELEGWQLVDDEIKEELLSSESNAINCLGNPQLFKAVTAVREDSDKDQWFTDGSRWIQCMNCYDNMKEQLWEDDFREEQIELIYKASLSELQDHFKIEKK